MLVGVLGVGFGWSEGVVEAGKWVEPGVVVAGILFLMALPLAPQEMWKAVRRPKAVALGIAVNSGLAPLLAWGASWGLVDELAAGMLIVGAVPCTLSSATVWTRKAGGNDAVALMVTLLTNLSCVVVTPIWLWAMTGVSLAEGELSLPRMMGQLSLTVALPILLAELVRRLAHWERYEAAWKVPVNVLPQLGVLLMVMIGAGSSAEKLKTLSNQTLHFTDWAIMLLSVMVVHLLLLCCGYWCGRLLGLTRADRIAVAFSGSQKTFPIGLSIALSYFTGLAMLPLIAFHVGQLLLDTLVADHFLRTAPPNDSPV